MGKGPPWSEEDLALLRDNSWMTNAELALKVGRTPNAVRIAKQNRLGIRTPRPRPLWTEEDSRVIADNWDLPAKDLAEMTGRTISSVRNERMRQQREAGVPAQHRSADVPEQDLWNCPPGVYEKVIGRLLIEDEEIMGHWMHAHGYSSFEIRDEDPKGWITITCWKDK